MYSLSRVSAPSREWVQPPSNTHRVRQLGLLLLFMFFINVNPDAIPTLIYKYFEIIFRIFFIEFKNLMDITCAFPFKHLKIFKKFVKILIKLIGSSYTDFKCLHGKKNSGKDF